MAQMFPDTSRSRVIFSSRAEEAFYTACRDRLGDGWRVYYSRTLSTIEPGTGLQDNEIDFVLYHRRFGVVVVEVKGGRIRHDADKGQFYSINRYGETFHIKDPFQQALVWKARFIRVLRKRNIRVPVSHVVALPSVSEEELIESASLVPQIVIGRQRLANLESSLKKIVGYSQPEEYLAFDDVSDPLHGLLWGRDFTTKLFLKDYLDSHELRVKDIEVVQETLVQPIASSARLAIEGEAGTGKTMLALMLARQFRNAGERVLFLSSNRLLNEYLKKEVGEGIDVKTYVEFAKDFGVSLLSPPSDFKGEQDDWTQYEAPERLRMAIDASKKRHQVLICDEAQDVQPFWWEAIESVLDEPSRFFIFFDRSQGVFGSGASDRGFVPEQVLPVAPPYFPLVYNYRTTREIATFARAFRTGRTALQSHCGRLGYVPELVVYDDREDCRGKLARLFRKLFREEGIAPGDVTLLSARHPSRPQSVVKPEDTIARYPVRLLNPERSQPTRGKADGKVDLCTITGFKGLETPVAILLNLSEHRLPIDNPIMASLIYVAATRAQHMLYILVQKDDPKRKAFQEALKLIQTAGATVLEGSDANFEFVGTVSYFNPNRVGWLSVEDPSFQKNSIMFFPHDVREAGLTDIGSGVKLRFRPRVEGQTTIATDLKPVNERVHPDPAPEPDAEDSGGERPGAAT
ncbi:MAG: NERD domain-containing protein [Gammaproteobacteria bacterium]